MEGRSVVSFGDSFSGDKYKLLELCADIEPYFVSNAEEQATMAIIGSISHRKRKRGEYLALTTRDKTFRLRKVDNSNTLLLFQDHAQVLPSAEARPSNPRNGSKGEISVQKGRLEVDSYTTHSYEVTLVRPDFAALRQKLASLSVSHAMLVAFEKQEQAQSLEQSKWSFKQSDLSRICQCSEEEFNRELLKYHIISVQGTTKKSTPCSVAQHSLTETELEAEPRAELADRKYIALNRDDVFRATVELVSTLVLLKVCFDNDEDQRPLKQLNVEEEATVRDALRSWHPLYLNEAMNRLSPGLGETGAVEKKQGKGPCFDGNKVSRLIAKDVLRRSTSGSGARGIPKQTFLDAWNILLPKGCTASLELLQGLAVIISWQELNDIANTKYTASEQVSYVEDDHLLPFNAEDLEVDGVDACTTFERLFAIRGTWNPKEIDVYIQHLISPEQTKAQLVKKYCVLCRKSARDDTKVLKARK